MKGENIATRLLVFGAGIVRLCRRLPEDASAKHIARQLVRAATGGGANYEEERGAESRADFIHKVGIANKELREALYWLRLTETAALVTDGELAALIREANELVAILTASIRTAKQRDVTSCAEERSWPTRDGGEPGSWYLVAPSECAVRETGCARRSFAPRPSAALVHAGIASAFALLPQRVWNFGELGLHPPRRSEPIRTSNQQRPNRE